MCENITDISGQPYDFANAPNNDNLIWFRYREKNTAPYKARRIVDLPSWYLLALVSEIITALQLIPASFSMGVSSNEDGEVVEIDLGVLPTIGGEYLNRVLHAGMRELDKRYDDSFKPLSFLKALASYGWALDEHLFYKLYYRWMNSCDD